MAGYDDPYAGDNHRIADATVRTAAGEEGARRWIVNILHKLNPDQAQAAAAAMEKPIRMNLADWQARVATSEIEAERAMAALRAGRLVVQGWP